MICFNPLFISVRPRRSRAAFSREVAAKEDSILEVERGRIVTHRGTRELNRSEEESEDGGERGKERGGSS